MIQASIDARQYRILLRTILRQFPFATAKALNTLALRFQNTQRRHQERAFQVRQKQYFRQAVKIPKGGFASVQNYRAGLQDDLRSRIIVDPKRTGTSPKKYDLFERQQFGGRRRPIKGRKKLAIPPREESRFTKVGLEYTGRGLIPKRLRPQNLKRTFVVSFGGGKYGLFRRISSRQKGYTKVAPGQRFGLKDDPNVQLMYVLHSSGQVEAVYEWYKNAEKVYRQWPAVFDYELEKAFRSARIRGAR